ncbi:MAG: hypothetical protein ABI947_14675 [Chloroflexota bacterium]
MSKRSRRIGWIWAGCIAGTIMLTGCRSNVPIVMPTLIPTVILPTLTPKPTLAATLALPTLPPTWTPDPTVRPTQPASPVPPTPPPNPAEQTAQAPISAITNDTGATILTITEAQLNAALARAYEDAPLASYTTAPLVTVGDGALVLTLSIVPQNAPVGAKPLTMTLVGTLAIYNGALEFQPTDLSPLNVGVTTRQVKLAHALLVRTLNEVARDSTGATGSQTFNFASIVLGQISLTLVSASS